MVAALLLVMLALAVAPLSTAGSQNSAGPDEIPAGAVVVPVRVPPDTAPPLALRAVAVDASRPDQVLIRFAAPFEFPDVFRYRVDLRVGRPSAAQERVTLVVEQGTPAGRVETTADGSDWRRRGMAAFTFEGPTLALEFPPDLREALAAEPQGETDPDGPRANLSGNGDQRPMVWVEVAVVQRDGGGATRVASPLVPAEELFGPGDASLSAASMAWGASDTQPPPPPVAVGTPPTLRVDGTELILAYEHPLPGAVAGRGVANVVEVLRITPPGELHGAAPNLVAIDHGLDTVILLDGLPSLPVEVVSDEDWLLDGLPESGVRRGTELRLDLAAVLRAFGIADEDHEAIALGMARSVTLVGGGVVRSEGVVVPVAVLEARHVQPAPPTTTPAPAPTASVASDEAAATDPAAGSADRELLQLVVFAAVIALAGTAGYIALRWSEHRRHLRGAGPRPSSTTPPAEPDEEDLERLREFTRQLFESER